MDCELVARARDGDREAFAAIADAIFDRCFEIARRIVGESPLAQDATQQALLSIWRDLPKLRDAAKFDAWSRRILVNACYAEIAKAKRTLPEPSILPIAPDEFASVVDRDELGRAFAHQKVEHRAVLVLRYYLDLPVEEVARTLDIPLGTAKSRIHHGLKAMRASLEAARRPARGTAGVTPGAINDYSRPAQVR